MADKKEIYLDGYDTQAKWSHIVAIVDFQVKYGYRLGNKLTTTHANYENYFMKVAIAAQTLSESVGETLKYLREILKIEQVTLICVTLQLLQLKKYLTSSLQIVKKLKCTAGTQTWCSTY